MRRSCENLVWVSHRNNRESLLLICPPKDLPMTRWKRPASSLVAIPAIITSDFEAVLSFRSLIRREGSLDLVGAYFLELRKTLQNILILPIRKSIINRRSFMAF